MGLAIFLGIATYVLIYSGFKGVNPLDVISAPLTGKKVKPTLTGGSGGSGDPPPSRPVAGSVEVGKNVARASAFFADAALRFDGIKNWGVYVVKKIRGTDTWSQHSYGNAVDIGVPDRETGDMVAAWARKQPGVNNVLWWQEDHYDHVHVDFHPQFCGDPLQNPHPCGAPA